MVDRSIGYIFSTETKEIEPGVDKGGFGMPVAAADTPAIGIKRKRNGKGGRGGNEEGKDKSEAISNSIMACATAMNKGMEKFADTVVTIGEYMRPKPKIVEGENWRLMAQIESKINLLESKVDMSAGDESKLIRLLVMLEKKEREAYGSV